MAMFRLDYLSCLLTVVATVLVGRKMWTGLVVSGINSLIVCVIGLHTSQYGFIPANVFCVCINAFNLRAWLKVGKDASEPATDANTELVASSKRMSFLKKGGHATFHKSFQNLQQRKAWEIDLISRCQRMVALRTNANVAVARPLTQFQMMALKQVHTEQLATGKR